MLSSNLRVTSEFFNERLAAASVRCKISDKDAVHIVIATAEGLEHGPYKGFNHQ